MNSDYNQASISSSSSSSVSPAERQSFLSSSAPVVDSFMQFDEDDVADDDVCMKEVPLFMTFILRHGLILLYICTLEVCYDDDDDDV